MDFRSFATVSVILLCLSDLGYTQTKIAGCSGYFSEIAVVQDQAFSIRPSGQHLMIESIGADVSSTRISVSAPHGERMLELEKYQPFIKTVIAHTDGFVLFQKDKLTNVDLNTRTIARHSYQTVTPNRVGSGNETQSEKPFVAAGTWSPQQGYLTPSSVLLPFPNIGQVFTSFNLLTKKAQRTHLNWPHTLSVLFDELGEPWARIQFNFAEGSFVVSIKDSNTWADLAHLPERSSNYFLLDISGQFAERTFLVVHKNLRGEGYNIQYRYSATQGLKPHKSKGEIAILAYDGDLRRLVLGIGDAQTGSLCELTFVGEPRLSGLLSELCAQGLDIETIDTLKVNEDTAYFVGDVSTPSAKKQRIVALDSSDRGLRTHALCASEHS